MYCAQYNILGVNIYNFISPETNALRTRFIHSSFKLEVISNIVVQCLFCVLFILSLCRVVYGQITVARPRKGELARLERQLASRSPVRGTSAKPMRNFGGNPLANIYSDSG